MIGRRGFITGLVALVAAPAIVRVASIMPVKVMIDPYGVGPMMEALLDAAHRQMYPPYLIVSPAFKKAFDGQMAGNFPRMRMIVTQDIPIL